MIFLSYSKYRVFLLKKKTLKKLKELNPSWLSLKGLNFFLLKIRLKELNSFLIWLKELNLFSIRLEVLNFSNKNYDSKNSFFLKKKHDSKNWFFFEWQKMDFFWKTLRNELFWTLLEELNPSSIRLKDFVL